MPNPDCMKNALLLASLTCVSAAQLAPFDRKDCVAGCGSAKGGDHCAKCANDPKQPSWSCASCCPGYKPQKIASGDYCVEGKGPTPPPPPPAGQVYVCYQGK